MREFCIEPITKFAYGFLAATCKACGLPLSAEVMQKFGIDGPKFVVVTAIEKFRPGMAVLYFKDRHFDVGQLICDPLTDLSAIEKEEGDFLFLSDVFVVGEPIGYRDLENVYR